MSEIRNQIFIYNITGMYFTESWKFFKTQLKIYQERQETK